jgi:hypothetical protein
MRGGGRLAEQAFIVYRLTGKDEERRSIQYFGSVEVYEQQLRQEAADLRVTWHLSKRLRCLEGLIGKTAKAEVLSNRLPLSEALAFEAAHTVVAHQADPTSRGGPYCLKRLHDKDEQELKDLAEICDIASWTTKVSRLQTLVSSWKSTSSMKRHLSNSCYKCGAKNWKTCNCRTKCLMHSVQENSSAARATLAMKSCSKSRSGSRQPMARVRRVGRDPMKKRKSGKSGKGKSGASRRKDLGLTPGTNEFNEFKYGTEAKSNVMKINENQYKKRKKRA